MNGLKVFYVGNSSYSIMLIPLKLYGCFGHGPKMCISFGSSDYFCYFFYKT